MSAPGTPAGLDVVLHNARRRARLTQQQLADLSTVSVRTIRDIEQGRVHHPRRGTVLLLADAMRLGEAGRSALQLAAGEGAVESVYRDVFGAQYAVPPVPVRPLIGRRNELLTLERLLGSEQERLVTVVGLPGVGKTRLAQEAAVAVHGRDRLPVLWVPADPAGEARLDTAGPLAALARWVRELLATGERHDELCTVIGDRPALLLLDGYEPLPAADARLMALLRSCARLKVLITASRPTRLPGGRLLPLAPLPPVGADPAGGEPGASLSADRPAVELMLSYVGHMRPDLLPTDSVVRDVIRVCRALDGLPGALEAAASWLLVYSPAQLADLAETAPLSLVDGVTPADPGSDAPLSERLAAVRAGLAPQHTELLALLASLPDRWTVEDAAAAAGSPLPLVARNIHALLMLGLVRDLGAEEGGTTGFTVLRLTRPQAPGRSGADEPFGELSGPEADLMTSLGTAPAPLPATGPAPVPATEPAFTSVRLPAAGLAPPHGPSHAALPGSRAFPHLAAPLATVPSGRPGSTASSPAPAQSRSSIPSS